MKTLKYLAIVFVAIIAVFAATLVYLFSTFDSARIKQEAAQAMLAKTGRTLTIDGDVSLRFWPSLGLKAGKTVLSEHNSPEPFAQFNAVNVSVKLLPLLSKQIAADTIELDGLRLVLIRDQEGHLNIDDLLGNNKDKDEKSPPPEIDVAGVRVTNAQLEWHDRKAKRDLTIADLDVSAGHIVSNANVQSIASLKVATSGKFDADSFQLALEVPAFSRKAAQMNAKQITLHATLKGTARNASASVTLNDVEGKLKDKLQALTIGGIVLDLDAQMGDKSLKGSLKTPLALDLDTSTAVLSDLAGVLALDMPSLPSHPLKLPLKGLIKAEYGKPAVSGNISAQFDESHIDTRFNVIGSSSTNVAPNIDIDINIDKLNVDKYLPPKPGKDPKPADDHIDLSVLKSINASGSLRVGELQVKNIKARNVRVSFKAAGGHVSVAPHSANLYGGSTQGALSLDANGNRISLKESMSGISIQPLLMDAVNKDVVEGRGDVALDIIMQGPTVAVLKKSLSGSARTVLRDGAIKGINIAQSLRNAKAALNGGDAVQQVKATDKTDFSELAASFKIANGVAHNDDLSAKSPFLRLAGSGDIDIGNSRLNYLLKAALVVTAAGQGGKDVDSLKGVTVPVRVSGPFEKPAFKLELANLVTDSAKNRINEKKQEAEQKLNEQVQDKFKGLFGK